MRTIESDKTSSRVQAKAEQEQPFFAPSLFNRQAGVGKVQRQEVEEETPIQTKSLMRKSSDGGYPAAPRFQSQLNSSKNSGSPLPGQTLASMNQAFGADFSTVRIHTGSQAAEMSQGIQAKAFTHGTDIYFNQGQYNPETSAGKRLLGHELTHVVQQNAPGKHFGTNGSDIQRTEMDTKELCPIYWRYNNKAKVEKYNCAGLSHRTYSYIGAKELIPLLKNGRADEKCKSGEVKHWLWTFEFHLEDHKGKKTEGPWADFHTVAGVIDKQGNDPTDVYSKNGPRNVEGPGTGPGFKPEPKEHAKANTPKGEPIYDDKKNPVYKIRKNIEEWTFCLPCPKS